MGRLPTGTIDRLKGGRYRARMPEPYGGTSVGTFATKTEARRNLDRAIAEYRDGHDPTRPKVSPTVRQALDAYLALPRLSESTRRTYRFTRERLDALAEERIHNLTSDTIARVIAGGIDAGLAPPSADQARRLLAAALNHQEHGLGTRLASAHAIWGRGTQAGRAARAARARTILTPDELAAIEAWTPALGRPDARVEASWGLWATLLAWTGLRAGESLALTAEGVLGAHRPVLAIRDAVTAADRTVGQTKTATSVRRAPVPAGLWPRLVEHAEHVGHGLLWPSRDGGPLGHTGADGRWGRICRDVDLGRPATLQDLRTTYVSVMLDAGASTAEVQAAVGHAIGSDVTDAHYATVVDGVAPWRPLRGSGLAYPDRLSAAHRALHDPDATGQPVIEIRATRGDDGRLLVVLPDGRRAVILEP